MRQLIAVALFCAGLFCIAQAQVPMTGAGLGAPSGGGGFTPSCSQSSTALAAATAYSTTGDKQNLDTLICGLVTDGNWNFDVFYVWAAPSATNGALVNLTNPGTFNGTTHGTVSFTAYQGYTGDGSTFYIDSGFNPSTAVSPNFVQNSANFGVYILNNRTAGSNEWNIAGANPLTFAALTNGQFNSAINSATTMGDANAAGTTQGSWNVTRTTSSTENIYRNSSESTADTASDTSQAPSNANVLFFGFAGVLLAPDQMAAGWIGKGLSNVNSCKVNNRINTYLQFVTGGGSDIRVYTNSAC